MNEDYDEIPRNPVGYALVALFCGVIGTVITFTLTDYSMVSTILGAVGMVIGGFAINVANHFPTRDRVPFMGLSAVGLMTSVIAFMFGLANWIG